VVVEAMDEVDCTDEIAVELLVYVEAHADVATVVMTATARPTQLTRFMSIRRE
jgi:hypothetical protein